MSQRIEGIRPALLSRESYQRLDALRGFRHFFRHAYAATVDYEQLRINLRKAEQVIPLLRADVEAFLAGLGPASGDAPPA
jgi:hypothetical protein